MINFQLLFSKFAASMKAGNIEIYNEFSLQHELGIFLRAEIAGSKVQFERNVSFFFGTDTHSFTKREIDIVVYSLEKRDLLAAIELKYPRNGQYPEQMFSFCKDIAFCEELRRSGFQFAATVIFADDPLFYQGASSGIYGYFRGQKSLTGAIKKPTGKQQEQVTLAGQYVVDWRLVSGGLMYTIVEASPAPTPKGTFSAVASWLSRARDRPDGA
ncbi:hypothetical protein AS156_30290 [Bradyrhizobium macuxiense]|uniref:Uncharacterized protein n=1 Tax=Bradyrhizobium macuxiense TaxID=1755647 RepID=A0A109K2U0_9BRAD|nr:hypothetical protein [Bradyrhizobium macuxiense]KWV59816.1 hypothetical protein AS156_30290 [Bradyrhizobium macuxiense]